MPKEGEQIELTELEKKDWVDTCARFGHLIIMAKGKERILYDNIKKEVYKRFTARTEMEPLQ